MKRQEPKKSVETQEIEKTAVTKTDDAESNNKPIDKNTIKRKS